MVRVAMSAEFAGLFPTQKPGKLSKIPTLMLPPTGVVLFSFSEHDDKNAISMMEAMRLRGAVILFM
jgi:hypothetical protein